MKNQLNLFFVTLLCTVFSSMAVAQSGNIQGTISDENGLYLPGASVMISSLSKGAISNFDGKFTLVDIPEGTYMLKVSYLGYDDTEKEVVVNNGETTDVAIFVAPKTTELEGVEVTAYGLGGTSKALNTQKNNINITNVVSTDQIGKFPDANIGDAVKRIPGITMQVDQGEARNIIIRGLSPQLNSVTLNGSRVPSAEGDNRNVQMDLIPSDMIQTIEVSKAVTPDMDADALGGSVNLITRTSPQGFRLSTTLGSGINLITDKAILNGSFIIGDRSENGKFGWMASASFNDNDFGSDNIEAEWTNEFEYYTGEDDAEGEPILEEVDVDPYVNVFEQRKYLVQRVRRSFSVNMDYKFNANNTIFLKTMYNWRDDRENRFALGQEILDAEDIELGDFTITNGVPTRFPAEIVRQSKGGIDNDRNKNRRLEDQRMQNYSLGGNHLWGSLKVDWMASYAKASEERLNERYAEFESEYIVNSDVTNSRYPRFYAADPMDATEFSNFEYGEITEENQYTEEEDFNMFVNFEIPVDLFGYEDGIIKFGARGRFKTKLRDNDFFEFDLEDTYETLASVPLKDYTDPDFYAGSQYAIGSFASEEWLGRLDLEDGESVPDEFLRANFNVEENVYAGYAMTNQKLSDKLGLLVGLRLENTNVTATGNQIEDEENVIGEITQESNYTNIMPGVHLKYDINDRTILRFAWTNTLARPNYEDIVPSLDIVSGDEEIFVGNSELEATTSMNFDVMGEHYFESVGLLSAGVFYKDIDKFIYTFQQEAADDSFGAGTEGFEVYQPLNGDGASVTGFEMAFQRQLDFLPGFAKNFSLYINYTYLSSSADGIRNEDGYEREDIDLPNTAPNMFNASLAYANKRFSSRLSANFSDSYIDEIGGNDFEDRYYDTQLFVDFNASYQINTNLSLYTSINNITNQPLRYFQGVKDRTMQAEFYGQRITFGLKYDLFNK
ncbi:TonB-dependent receptor [Maribacter dokdonensis]|uniref:TonB-dependent receptor n=2 Tax=Maribacter dokdonensis TaxID=320912 RepID=UPI003D662EF7